MHHIIEMPHRLDNKVAVVTGGNAGIGLATALLFRAEGAKVAIFGRTSSTVTSAVVALGGSDYAYGFTGDIAKVNDVAAFYDGVKAKFGYIDIVFANAGIAERQPLTGVTEDSYNRIFSTNVFGVMSTVKNALPLLRDGGSVIVNTSVVGQIGAAGSSVYAASKGAVRSFVRSFAAELIPRKIRVNAVGPGPIEGDGQDRLNGTSEEQQKAMKARYEALVPMKRMGTADEVARAVLFFASDDSTYTTGAELMVDGGWTQL